MSTMLTGKGADDAAIATAAALAASGVETSGDIYDASLEYRAHLTRVYARRALRSAVARTRGAA